MATQPVPQGPGLPISSPVAVPSGDDSYSIERDDDTGVIRLRYPAFKSVAQVERYIFDFRRAIERTRLLHRRVRVLADRRSGGEQSADVYRVLRTYDPTLPQDLVAIVVDTNIAKARVRHQMARENVRAFLSYDAAEAWLYGAR